MAEESHSEQDAGDGNGRPLDLKQRAKAAGEAYLVAAGHTDDKGIASNKALAGALTATVSPHVCMMKDERSSRAITRRSAFEAVLPDVPSTTEQFQTDDDPDLAEATFKQLWSNVWDLLKPDKGGAVQKSIGGNGLGVLCRTQIRIGEDGREELVDAVYITKDRDCILADYNPPQHKTAARVARTFAENTEMLIDRVPEFGEDFATDYGNSMQRALRNGKNTVKGALERATGGAEAEAESSNDEE